MFRTRGFRTYLLADLLGYQRWETYSGIKLNISFMNYASIDIFNQLRNFLFICVENHFLESHTQGLANHSFFNTIKI